ncbi:MAG: hypothetical protein J6C00_13040 [Eubacterium sp.]|nr:hypothetical protein [Eubacterium sp.]
MQKKIKFGNTEIKVTNVYPFKYSNGKVVLRVSASEQDTDEATLKLLQTNTAPIEYYETVDTQDEEGNIIEGEEFILKNTYEGYESGEYVSSYSKGVYEVEVTRMGEIEKAVKQNTADIEYVAAMSGVDL